MSLFKVVWRGAEIGTYTVTGIDMWYWDGIFSSLHTEEATKFTQLAMSLDMKAVMRDPGISTWVLLHPEEAGAEPTYALVNGMTSATDLHVRMLYDPKAIAWLIEHVDAR